MSIGRWKGYPSWAPAYGSLNERSEKFRTAAGNMAEAIIFTIESVVLGTYKCINIDIKGTQNRCQEKLGKK